MSDSQDRKVPEGSTENRSRFEDTVDELTRRADDLVEALAMDEEETPPEEESMAEMAMDEAGEDLDAKLDSLFELEGDPVPVTQGVATEAEDAEVMAGWDECAPASEVPEELPVEIVNPPSHGFRPSWMIAAAVLLAALAGGIWVTVFHDSGATSGDENLSAALKILPLPPTSPAEDDPVVEDSPTKAPEPADPKDLPSTIEVASVTTEPRSPRPVEPRPVQRAATKVEKPAAKPAVVNVEPPRAAKPEPRPQVVATAPSARPEPEPRTVTAVEVPTSAKPEPAPRTVEVPVPETHPVVTAEPAEPKVPDPAPSMLAPATTIETSTAAIPEVIDTSSSQADLPPTADAEHPPIAFPTVEGFQAPEAVDRREPIWPDDLQVHGQPMAVVLKVLISEKGRVVSVVVEESVPDARAEAAAINALLHWTYVPAMDGGRPVRSWITERFEY